MGILINILKGIGMWMLGQTTTSTGSGIFSTLLKGMGSWWLWIVIGIAGSAISGTIYAGYKYLDNQVERIAQKEREIGELKSQVQAIDTSNKLKDVTIDELRKNTQQIIEDVKANQQAIEDTANSVGKRIEEINKSSPNKDRDKSSEELRTRINKQEVCVSANWGKSGKCVNGEWRPN
jgi:biopolymer transport protein ExbB/TolQ